MVKKSKPIKKVKKTKMNKQKKQKKSAKVMPAKRQKKKVEKVLRVEKKTEKKNEPVVEEKKAVNISEDQPVELKLGKGKTLGLLRGMKDILPKEEGYWKRLYHTAENLADAYGFSFIETPILEDVGLFVRSIGKGTDVVDKEMYVFEDLDGSKVCLRPEATASVARAYIIHGMQSWPQPVKMWYYGPMFRHDRPQAGRYREFHQFSCESFGVQDSVMDAELIAVGYNFFKELGIDTVIHINSIGKLEERQNYIVELVGYLRSKRGYLCEECKKRLIKNPLRALDCKEESCQPIIEEAPQIIDWLSESSRNYFMKVLEYLDELDIPYTLRSTLVRGLDYYSDTVFEFYREDGEGSAQSALGGGGRYDTLVEQLGGKPTPGCGFSIGLERVVSAIRAKQEAGELPKEEETNPIYFAQLGEQARKKTLKLLEDMRKQGIIVKHNLGKGALKAQMEMANKFKAKYCLILGQKEVQDGTVIIRDMESGIQEIVDQKKLVTNLKRKLEVIAENSVKTLK